MVVIRKCHVSLILCPEVVFSEWLESVRKDVRGFVVYQDADIIENAFKTAAMLHNMLIHRLH